MILQLLTTSYIWSQKARNQFSCQGFILTFLKTKSDDLAISTFDIFEMKMSDVLMAKSSLLVFKKGDDFLKHYLKRKRKLN